MSGVDNGHQNDRLVAIAFNIDTEGPGVETLEHSFMRVRETFGVNMEPTQANLERLQHGDIQGVDEDTRLGIMVMLRPDRLAFLSNWEQIDEMMNRFCSDEWRSSLPDSFGGGWKYNYYVTDLIGYDYNPRRRAMGYHHVYDFYRQKIREAGNEADRIWWHFHGPGFVRHAHLDVFNLWHTDHHVQNLSRRIIDRLDFPACFRPGMDIIRPDHNFFLELWIPFDYSNQAIDPSKEQQTQKDDGPGRFGDTRRSPREWIVYHPDHFDYQKPGNMKRYVGRCLYSIGRLRQITQEECDRAFARADGGRRTLMSVCCHDSRDMTLDLARVNGLIQESARRYLDVKFKYGDCVEAMRLALDLPPEPPATLEVKWNDDRFEITSDKVLWGPQPFFCFKTWDHRYYHDNLDKQSDTEWTYTFDWQTVDRRAIAQIGVATNDDYGNTTVLRWDADPDQVTVRYHNADGTPGRD